MRIGPRISGFNFTSWQKVIKLIKSKKNEGRISLHDVDQLLKKFKLDHTRELVSTYKSMEQIFLSKNGKAFLEDLSFLDQYWNMVLCFWQKVNWGYFSPGRVINGLNVAEVLQNNYLIT